MAARRVSGARYSEEDKARVYVAWITNGQVMKRTARDTGVPEGTLRRWIKEWEENGPPVEQIEKIAEFAGEFIEDAERIRNKALMELERLINAGEVSPAQLVAATGMLTDKLNMAKGLATSRTEHVQSLPQAEDIAQVLRGALQHALQAAEERDADIIDVEVVALPAAK